MMVTGNTETFRRGNTNGQQRGNHPRRRLRVKSSAIYKVIDLQTSYTYIHTYIHRRAYSYIYIYIYSVISLSQQQQYVTNIILLLYPDTVDYQYTINILSSVSAVCPNSLPNNNRNTQTSNDDGIGNGASALVDPPVQNDNVSTISSSTSSSSSSSSSTTTSHSAAAAAAVNQDVTLKSHSITRSKPLLKLKLLNILRQGDLQLLTTLLTSSQFTPLNDPNVHEVTKLILNYAVQLAPTQLVKDIINNFINPQPSENPLIILDINQRDKNGNTPLHLAAYQSRNEIVTILMDHPKINDCLLNNMHLQPIEMCKNLNTAQLIQFKRSNYVAEIAQEFRLAFNNRDFNHLETILNNDRNAQLLDINGMDPETGDTVLHEFVKKRDVIMCRWLLEHGADPFKRDVKGKLPINLIPKINENEQASNTKMAIDIELKKLLEKAIREQSVIDITNGIAPSPLNTATTTSRDDNLGTTTTTTTTTTTNKNDANNNINARLHEPPTFKGYLKKWTNFAQGYKLRWFILSEDGRLSYYIDQSDTKNACRGSLNLSSCNLHLDSSEKLKFEIIGGTNGSIRWHLKGNHPIETSRWVWTIQGAIRFAKDREIIMNKKLNNNPNMITNSTIHSLQQNSQIIRQSSATVANHNNTTGDPMKTRKRKSTMTSSSTTTTTNSATKPSLLNENTNDNEPTVENSTNLQENLNDNESHHNEQEEEDEQEEDEEDDDDEDEDDDDDDDDDDFHANHTNNNDEEDVTINYGPYSTKVHMLQRSITIELNSLTDLLNDDENPTTTTTTTTTTTITDHDNDMWDTMNHSIDTITKCFNKLNDITSKRDKKLLNMLDKQKDVNNVWIQSMKDLEMELIDKDKRLVSLDKERKHLKKMLQKKLLEIDTTTNDLTTTTGTTTRSSSNFNQQLSETQTTDNKYTKMMNSTESNAQGNMESPTDTLEEIAKFINATKDSDEDSDIDEFFDAEDVVESDSEQEQEQVQEQDSTNTTPQPKIEQSIEEQETIVAEKTNEPIKIFNTTVTTTTTTTTTALTPTIETVQSYVGPNIKIVTEIQELNKKKLIEEGTFLGYEDGLRKKLSLDKDERPKVSLWSVLKSMVGKDMTKMTLPVTFNEPTSLLQRVSEDLEYSQLLDQAASFNDSTLRLLYVAAFSASIYSSTTNRIAKPFNPLLGETFEYTNPNASYRFFTEQVSHHPPISATWTESPKWDFYGESRVEMKFNGRSFGVKHLGLWYIKMRPDNNMNEEEEEEEIYTFKKPDNSVIGILVGNPQLDNHGEVKIKNHKTGDYCILNFKARGWTSAGAYEVKGDIYNKNNEKIWVLGGHWNDAIYAKKITNKNTSDLKLDNNNNINNLHPNTNLSTNNNSSSRDNGPRYDGTKFMIWKTNERIESPFNLTPFAITLNAPQPHLIPYLAPTDSRLRPDQRAMEDGKYDIAAEERNRLEEKQRAVRKEREKTGKKYQPQWFVKDVHPVTNEPYWRYNGEYWKLRKQHNFESCPDIF
ncbi:uncharacterized protein NDAI_0G03020 [Naumovozyma dairenensis CBS 421]|uniref:PH domain-containing protein n=1 Tax=Naumovozyma dairenensis (strain ATCC 10597 / BCRC 20456 / CBS 421 / NBRC 0211 / NRRL Y-12639) TaxID=1071378 RepID=G0WE68_NAUDC|nr:hypothetical protein NDAI_0G03020 [Naumovozyma dairenensis CBS 421]CCD26079.2 hypothetical protein NDAI_0G03020 [Naumovozyma dairenensis CBS 421]